MQVSGDLAVKVDAIGRMTKFCGRIGLTRNVVIRPRKTQVSQQTPTARCVVTVLRTEILVVSGRAGRGESVH
jgi:hypothetical protein